jgi:hypothetical protein
LYEKNINKIVTKYAKRQARLWDAPENVVPTLHAQVDTDMLEGVKQIASNLKHILERKVSSALMFDPAFLRNMTSESQKNFS